MKFYSLLFTGLLSIIIITSQLHAEVPRDEVPNTFVSIPVSSPEDVDKLLKLGLMIELNIVEANSAKGFISKNNLEKIRNAGFNVSILDEDIEKSYNLNRKDFYDFDDVRDELIGWIQAYPSLTSLDTVGRSIRGVPIWEFIITGSPDTAARQRIFLNGATHGNENIGTEVVMWIANHLLTKYGSDQTIKDMVDRSEFVIHPIINPDGFLEHRRTLDNGRDPNRSFGWQAGGPGDSYPYEWPEMQSYRDCMIRAPFYLNFDYHCGMTSLLKPFFASIDEDLDRTAYSELSDRYPLGIRKVDYFTGLYSRGGGISCDCSYGKCGSMAFLPELCNHNPSSSLIETIGEHNRECVYDVIDEMQKGICGRIYDSKSGVRLYARIQVKGSHSAVFSHPVSGAYFKYVPFASGTYEVTAFANGYKPVTKTVEGVSDSFAKLDFALEFDSNLKYSTLSVDALLAYNSISHSDVYKCLEAPDDIAFTLQGGSSPKGFVNMDLGPTTPVINQTGDDLTVYATNNTTYSVSVAYDIDDIDDNANKLGTGQGEASFDLESAGLDSARFIQISLTSGSVELDAIEVEPREVVIGINSDKFTLQNNYENHKPRILYNNGRTAIVLLAYIPQGWYEISVYDLMGRNVYTLDRGEAMTSAQKTFQWNGSLQNGKSCAEGTYMFRIETSCGKKVVKGLLVR